MLHFRVLVFAVFAAHALAAPAAPARVTVSLNGSWQIADSVAPDEMPQVFDHKAPVPGLANQATPAFEDVGRFVSRELARHPLVKLKDLPIGAADAPVGISLQKRNYFWYRRTFRSPKVKQVAILKINKAQFGTAVWLNGKQIGEYRGCFSAGYFDLTGAMNRDGENRLDVRIGAHPGTLPPTVPAGTDLEKLRWIPGIYDDVSLILSDNPVIETIQVAPRISRSEIVVQTALKNYGDKPSTFQLAHVVKSWKGSVEAGRAQPLPLTLAPGEQRSLTQVVQIRNPRLWSPEDPFLYVVESSTGGDGVATRFGMREFRFDRATGWGYLNNRPYFLRGANITLHRFFEDPKSGSLPWQEKWVRKLLADLPKRMHWNSFRFCIGPVPDRWLDIADEAGLLIQNQFFIWVPGPAFGHQEWDLIPHFKDWMRDNWNHPSVAIWDSANETRFPALSEKVIPAVRGLDLSNRPWQNSNNPAVDPDDPVERHLYVLKPNFDWSYFEQPPRARRSERSRNPGVVNEYGEFWLNRDGTPTSLTTKYFEELVGANATPEERFAAAAYYLAGETEFHRAHRRHAAVQHFVYLTSSFPGGYTSDNFRDVEKLVLDPYFLDYVGESFKPLGVYLNFWQSRLKAGSGRKFTVMMVNDHDRAARGRLVLSLESESGRELARTGIAYSLDAAGQGSYELDLRIPDSTGRRLLKAAAYPAGPQPVSPTLSRRKVSIMAQ